MNRAHVALLALAVVLLGRSAATSAAVDLAKVRAKADALAAAKRYAAAAALYERMLETAPVESPMCLDALRALRRAYDQAWVGQKFVRAAERLLARVKAADLDAGTLRTVRRNVLRTLASYHYDHRQPLGAIRRYEQVRELSDEKEAASVERRLADLYEEAGYFEKALAIWRKRLAAAPDSRSLRSKVARLLFRAGKVQEGLDLVGAGQNASAVLSIAEQLFRAKYLPEAEALARKIAPDNPRATFLLGQILYDQKKFGEAAKVLTACFAAAKETSHRLFSIAAKLAEVHAARGTLKAALRTRETELAGLGPEDAADKLPARRKLLALLSELKKGDGDLTGAFDALLARRAARSAAAAKPPPRDWRLERLGRDAVRQLFRRGRQAEAEALLDRATEAKVGGIWMDCARVAMLSRAGHAKPAAALVAKLEADAGEKESKIYSLADQFHDWGLGAASVRLWKRILEVKPDKTVYDANAHARLASYCMGKRDYAKAKAHCDALDASLTGRNMGLIGMERFRRMEAYATYRASGSDAGVLEKMLTDPRPLRRIAGAELLGRYGKPSRVPRLKACLAGAAPKLRMALQDAISSIEARAAMVATRRGPLSEEKFREQLARRGRVLWIRKDRAQPHLMWGAVAKKFVCLGDARTGRVDDFDDAVEILGYKDLSPSGIAFTRDVVWVGTDHGLFAFERQARSWNAYAVGRQHLDVPVTALAAAGRQLLVTVTLKDGAGTFRFDPGAGKWTEER